MPKRDDRLIGDARPRILHLPTVERLPHVSSEVDEIAKLAGLELDPWESWVMQQACSVRSNSVYNPFTNRDEPQWSAFEVGIMVSRQNGKSTLMLARELAGLFLFGERLIIHTAQELPTAIEHFGLLMDLIEATPDFDRQIARVPRSHGYEGIELKNGQRLRFKARTKSGGRGWSADLIIFDEGQYLELEPIAALMPTVITRPNPQLWYLGTAGNRQSRHFGRVRNRALRGDDPELAYFEWSADICTDFCPADCTEHDDPSDQRTWAKANPNLGVRLPLQRMRALHRSMEPEAFAREHLGVGDWPPDSEGWLVVTRDQWMDRKDVTSQIRRDKPFVLGVHTGPNFGMSCIVAAGMAEGSDLEHIEVTGDETYDYRPGFQWLAKRVIEIWKSQHPECVVINPSSQTGAIVRELEAAGVKVMTPSQREYAQSCSTLVSKIAPRKGDRAKIVHVDQKPLELGFAAADKRTLLGLWAWSVTDSTADITPVIAATLADLGYSTLEFEEEAVAPWVFIR